MTGFTKRGESLEIRLEEAASCIPEVNEAILESFAKTAAALKKLPQKLMTSYILVLQLFMPQRPLQ